MNCIAQEYVSGVLIVAFTFLVTFPTARHTKLAFVSAAVRVIVPVVPVQGVIADISLASVVAPV
jgi:hypothetical protein